MKKTKSFRIADDVEERLVRLSENNSMTQTAIVELLIRSSPEKLKVLLRRDK